MEWAESALCRGLHPDLWYAPMDAPSPNDYYAVGKLVCHQCPVWEECLEYSKTSERGKQESWGMWGGLTPQERRGVTKLVHGTVEGYRRGCGCDTCRCSEVQTTVDLTKIPKKLEKFDVSTLLYELIGK